MLSSMAKKKKRRKRLLESAESANFKMVYHPAAGFVEAKTKEIAKLSRMTLYLHLDIQPDLLGCSVKKKGSLIFSVSDNCQGSGAGMSIEDCLILSTLLETVGKCNTGEEGSGHLRSCAAPAHAAESSSPAGALA